MASPPPSPAPPGGPPPAPGRAPRLRPPPPRHRRVRLAPVRVRARCVPAAEPWTPAERHAAASFDCPNPCTSRARPGASTSWAASPTTAARWSSGCPSPRRVTSPSAPTPPSAPSSEPSVRITSLPARGEAPTTTAGEGRAETFGYPSPNSSGTPTTTTRRRRRNRIESRHLAAYARLRDRFERAARPSDGRRTSRGSCSFSTASTRASDSSRANTSPWSFDRTSPRAPASARAPRWRWASRSRPSARSPPSSRSRPPRPHPPLTSGVSRRSCASARRISSRGAVRVMDQMASACGLEAGSGSSAARARSGVRRPAAGIRRARGRRGRRRRGRAEAEAAARSAATAETLTLGQDPDVDRSSVGNTNNPYGERAWRRSCVAARYSVATANT